MLQVIFRVALVLLLLVVWCAALEEAQTKGCVCGYPGIPGDPGHNGTPGRDGRDGLSGEKGDRGEVGSTGLAGSNGAKGDKGELGAVGPAGLKGKRGDNGERGPPGKMGPQGVSGPLGLKGNKGELGLPGPQGPKAGAYYFTYHITVFSRNVKVVLMKNGVKIIHTTDNYQNSEDQAAGGAVLHLEVGDRVWLQVAGGELFNGLFADEDDDTTFSGFLIFAA
ncbi:unnamed protein product [Pleuronectes platessa]|uniref:C1q domain-containing protein n=1 Tax=Pleuronectes platessa TaxID=8262 RepID=A0A9N7VK85_PLEPL|nr:unnamed protein product [Pleuronectes platessa]